jgi:hypothetical protein
MPDIVFDALHLEQGFNFRQDVQDACGFITSLHITKRSGHKDGPMKADINVSTPGTDGVPAKQPVVGVMRHFKWSGGLTDPIELKFNVSTPNRNKIFGLLQLNLPSTDVTFSYQIFYFDQEQATFYLAMAGAATLGTDALSANIAKEGKEKLLLTLPSQLASETVKSPQNWEVELTAMPQQLSQAIMYQYSPGNKITKSWGVTVA